MVSNKAKGNKFENECIKILDEAGYATFKAQSTAKFIGPGRIISMANDFFGLFDIIAKEPKTGKTRWIQCKFGTKTNISTAKTKIKPWAEEYTNYPSESCEVWHREPYQKVVDKYKYDKIKELWVKE